MFKTFRGSNAIVRLLFALATASAANAQVLHVPFYPFNGAMRDDQFGYAVSEVGDVNNDGFDDFIVGAPVGPPFGGTTDIGFARVYSGASGAILYTFNGDSAFDQFGISVSGAGDVNNDSVPDFIVGARGDDNTGLDSGSARVFSGANGAILYTFNGDSAGDSFGVSVSGAGDVNNDGFDDLIVGATGDDNNGSNSGSARVFSGVNGSVLYTVNGDNAGDAFGHSVSVAGDIDGDGALDSLVVGAPFDDNNGNGSGSVRFIDAGSGTLGATLNGESAGDQFGWSVSDLGDVNGDGFDDVIVGAPQDDNTSLNSGSARVISGMSMDTLYTLNGDRFQGQFGYSVSGLGRISTDVYSGIVVGSRPIMPSEGSGRVHLFSGRDGVLVLAMNGDSTGDHFGHSVSGVGDANNDGFDDFIVGAVLDDNNGTDSGSARVFVSLLLPASPAPCPADADDNGSVTFNDITIVLANLGAICP